MHQRENRRTHWMIAALGMASVVGLCQPAMAATLCVNPGGTGGCYAGINLAIAHASANDTIQVAHGTYKEYVVIKIPLSLIGDHDDNTIIDATGLPNGIFINGTAAAPKIGIANVNVSGFTIRNAMFEGILVANAALVTITGNKITGNNTNLLPAGPSCPDIYPFETASDFDCGEGIHLSGVVDTTVANNELENNSGGILISDDTGPSAQNLITGNTIRNNPFDCGIVMASHPPAKITGATSPLGISRNTIAQNTSDHNGTAVPGAGAGVGIFGFLPGANVSNNVIIGNKLTNNGLPGVAFHGHFAGPVGETFNNNVIVGNEISGNGPDTDDALTPGSTGINVFSAYPIVGTIISQNKFDNEKVDIVINTPASSEADINLNNLGNDHATGVDNLGAGFVNATQNWWNCPKGPGAGGCTSVAGPVFFTPWLTNPPMDFN